MLTNSSCSKSELKNYFNVSAVTILTILIMAFEDAESDSLYYLEFAQNILTFQGASQSKLTNVFYDESNTQVFSISSSDINNTEVVVKSPYPDVCRVFKMQEKGRVMYIKFSPDMKILCVQRSHVSVDFLVFNDSNEVSFEFSHTFGGSSKALLGFMWLNIHEIVFVTDQSVQICRVNPSTKNVGVITKHNVVINWFSYYPMSTTGYLILNYGEPLCNNMLVLEVSCHKIIKIAKFNLGEDVSKSVKSGLSQRDVFLGIIYDKPRILIMNYQNANNVIQAEIIIYTIFKKSEEVKKTQILRTKQSGRFAVNIVDNLIVVHSQISKTSIVFDVGDENFKGPVTYLNPIASPMSIAPFKDFELYSQNWVVFQPNVILDAKLGCLWFLETNLAGFPLAISDPTHLVAFLLMRSNPEKILALVLEDLVCKNHIELKILTKIFNQINLIYRKSLEENLKGQVSLTSPPKIENDPCLIFKTVLDQVFIYTYVFSKLADRLNSKTSDPKEIKLFYWTLLEYIQSLINYEIPVDSYFYILLINTLVTNKDFYQLHQLLQYHAIADSKPLACLLLSLENVYPAGPQLAIDMLYRIGSSEDEIIEILLSKQQVLPALRYANSHHGTSNKILPAKYIEVAQKSGNESLYYAVLNHFSKKL